MQDAFTGQPTCIRGTILPDAARRAALQDNHERRLEALDRLSSAANKCGVRADKDLDLVLLDENEIILLEAAGGDWGELVGAIRAFRAFLPVRPLTKFGFPNSEGDLLHETDPLDVTNPILRKIGVGVEAWAFEAASEGSIYKFYRPREGKSIGSEFEYQQGSEPLLLATAKLGTYRGLFEKLLIIVALGGMATEVVAITPEGIIVAKQSRGEKLPQGDDMSRDLPSNLIEIPSRFLRADRDHPRLLFLRRLPYLVADLHAGNFVKSADGTLRVIDLVAGPWPTDVFPAEPLIAEWLSRVSADPQAPALRQAPDHEL